MPALPAVVCGLTAPLLSFTVKEPRCASLSTDSTCWLGSSTTDLSTLTSSFSYDSRTFAVGKQSLTSYAQSSGGFSSMQASRRGQPAQFFVHGVTAWACRVLFCKAALSFCNRYPPNHRHYPARRLLSGTSMGPGMRAMSLPPRRPATCHRCVPGGGKLIGAQCAAWPN